MKCLNMLRERVFKHLLLLFIILSVTASGPALAVETVALEPYTREISLTGFTRARSEMTISSELSGRCLGVFVDKGDTLGQGGLVAKLDETFVSLELENNKIAREQAERRLLLQNKTVARYTTLIRNESTPLTTLEEVSLQADIYRLTLKNLENEGARLRELQERHTIRGPSGWRVIERLVEPGEYITQGQPVIRLGDFTALVVTVLLTYEELTLISSEPGPDLYFPEVKMRAGAKVYRVAPGFDELSKKIEVDLLIDHEGGNRPAYLRGGLLVNLNLKKNEEATFVVPYRSLINRYDSYWLETPGHERVKVVLLGKIKGGVQAIISGDELAKADVYLAFPEGRSGTNKQFGQ